MSWRCAVHQLRLIDRIGQCCILNAPMHVARSSPGTRTVPMTGYGAATLLDKNRPNTTPDTGISMGRAGPVVSQSSGSAA